MVRAKEEEDSVSLNKPLPLDCLTSLRVDGPKPYVQGPQFSLRTLSGVEEHVKEEQT